MIGVQLGLPRSTVYQLLATLQEHRYVVYLADEHRYGLGMAAVELSFAYTRHEPLTRIGAPLLARLVDDLGLSGHLSVPRGRDMLYVIEQRARGSRMLVTDVHVRLPMPLTASGRAYLSALPKPQVRALFPNQQAFEHWHGDERDIVRYSALRAVLDETRTKGYALESGSITQGLSSVGVPVLDHRDWPVAAIAVTYDTDTVDADRRDGAVAALRRTATRLSQLIYGRQTP
jgi:DNA-binding IclR family transcriptional regulator